MKQGHVFEATPSKIYENFEISNYSSESITDDILYIYIYMSIYKFVE